MSIQNPQRCETRPFDTTLRPKAAKSWFPILMQKLLNKTFCKTITAPNREHAYRKKSSSKKLLTHINHLLGVPKNGDRPVECGAPTLTKRPEQPQQTTLEQSVSLTSLWRNQVYLLLEEQLDLIHTIIDPDESADPALLTALDDCIEKIVLINSYPPDLLTLAHLCFYFEHSPTKAKNLLNKGQHEELIKLARECFQEAFQKCCVEVKKRGELQQKFHPSFGNLFYYSSLGEAFAKLLLSKNGTINVGLLSFLQEECIHRAGEQSYARSMEHSLGILLENAAVRKKIHNLQAPQSPKKASNLVIQGLLGMSRNEVITAYDARVAGLSALFSHLRQGPKRACFASYLAINLKNAFLERCIEDLSDLLENSSLERDINGVTHSFIFLTRVADPYIGKEFQLKGSGSVYIDGEKVAKIWEHEGMIHALKILNYPSPEKTLRHYCKKLEKGQHTLTFKELIEHFAQRAVEKKQVSVSKGRALENACFAFSGSWTNLLMRSWVNAIAGMAESQANCYFSSSLIKAILSALHPLLGEKTGLSKEQIAELERKICEYLVRKVRFLYDPTIGTYGEESEGGFVLYKAKKKQVAPLASSAALERFLTKAIRQFGNDLPLPAMEEIRHSFIRYIGFTMERAERCKIYPWVSPLGHDSLEIMRTYLERGELTESHLIIPKSAEELLVEVVTLLKALPAHEQKMLKEMPDSLRPVRIVNEHAFSLMPCHSTFKEAWQGEKTTRRWIDKTLIAPSKSAASKELPTELAALGGSYAEVREALIKEKGAKEAETLLINALRGNGLQVAHFADTNMQSGLKDIHYCFLYNPGTQRIEIWQALDGDMQLIPVPQDKLIGGKNWEFFLYADKIF